MFIVAFLVILALLIGVIFIAIFVAFICLFILLSIIVVIYLKTKHVLVPKLTLFVLNLLENPISVIAKFVGVKSDAISQIIVDIRNCIFDQTNKNISFNDRMLFLPYCLRNRECPARLEEDGLMCVKCGRCDIGSIKKEAEDIGYKVFIVPGSSLIKKIIARNRPKAVIGVGCHSEVREGAVKMAAIGMPVKGLILDKDGCIDTKVNVSKLISLLKL